MLVRDFTRLHGFTRLLKTFDYDYHYYIDNHDKFAKSHGQKLNISVKIKFCRTTALGTASASARIGSMASPFIDLLSEYQDGLSLAVYGSFLLLGTICSIFVWPETKSLKMTDSIEECEDLARGKNKWLRCTCCV